MCWAILIKPLQWQLPRYWQLEMCKDGAEKNVLSEGQEYGYSDSFGVVTTGNKIGNRGVLLRKAAIDCPAVVEMSVKRAGHEHGIMKAFPCMTFIGNGGLETKMYRDLHNAGSSCSNGLGDYKKRQMVIWGTW